MDKHISDMLYAYNHNNVSMSFEDDKTKKSTKNLINPCKFNESIQINKDNNFCNNKTAIDQKGYINQKYTNKSKNVFTKNQISTKLLTSLEDTLHNSMLNNSFNENAKKNNKFCTPKKENLKIEMKTDKNVNILTEELKKQTIASLQNSNISNIETRLLRRHTTCENKKKEIFLEQSYKNENSSFTTNAYNTNSDNNFTTIYDNFVDEHTEKDNEYVTKLYMFNKVKNSDTKVVGSKKEKIPHIDKKGLFKDVCKSFVDPKLENCYENSNHSSKEDNQESYIRNGNKREMQSVILNCSNSLLNKSNINMEASYGYIEPNIIYNSNSTYIGKKNKTKRPTKQGETHTCEIGQEDIEKVNGERGEVITKSNISNSIDFVPLHSSSDYSNNFCEEKNSYYNIADSNEKRVEKKNIKNYDHFESIKKVTKFKGNSPNLYLLKKTVFEALKKNKNYEKKINNSNCENNSSNILEGEENGLEKKQYVNVMNPSNFPTVGKKEKIVPTRIEKNYSSSSNRCNTNFVKCSILSLSNKKNNCFNNFCHESSDNNNSSNNFCGNENIKGKKNYKKIVIKKNKINNPQNSIKNDTLINAKNYSIGEKKKKNIDDFFPSTHFLLSNGAEKTNLSSSDIIEKKKLYNNLNMVKNKYSIYSDNIKVKNSATYNVTNKDEEMLKDEKTKEECGNEISSIMPKENEKNVRKMETNCSDFIKRESKSPNYVFKKKTNYFYKDRKPNEIKNDNGEEKINNIKDVCAQNGYKKNNVMHDILSNNQMIIKDIEEIKKNKLFFEDICVFRMNEYTDESEQSDIYNYSDIRSEFFQSEDDYDKEIKRKPINLFELNSYNDVDISKLELNKNCYEHLNEEVTKLIKEEDTYNLEMNIGLMFKKYINVIMNLSYNYLIIKKNEKNVLTCISYNNIIEIDIIKRNLKKGKISFKLVYVFKKKELKAEKNITLIFKTNEMGAYEKIKEKIGPVFGAGKTKSSHIGSQKSNNIMKGKGSPSKVDKKKIYIDAETVYNYIINKYKQVHLLYLSHLLQMTEKKFKRKAIEQGFKMLRVNCEYAKEIEEMGKKKIKLVTDFTNKLEYCTKRYIQKNYFNILLIKGYETHFINYQKKTNDMLFNVIVKEKSAYEENIGRQSILLLFNALASLYKSKMSKYFRSFVNNNRNFSKGKNAFSYTLTHINTILAKYETRHKAFVLSRLKFNYNNVSYFSFVMYKTYLKKLFLGYICLRDNRIFIKLVIEKNVIKLVNRISRVVENQKYYAFLKLQKYIYEEKEKINKKICDNLMYTNNELCNNMDKIGMEKGINILEYFYKFKIKENLIKYFYILKGSQVSASISQNKFYLKYSAIFVFVLNKIFQRKVQDILFHFVLKCFQTNNKNKLIYSTKNLESLFIQKEKRDAIAMLKFYDKFPYLFKYRNMNKAEIFTACIQNFINTYNRKLLLNFLLRLHFVRYKEKFMKAYNCIGHIYNFTNILSKKFKKTVRFPFMLLLQNVRIINNQILVHRLKIKKKTQLKNSNHTRTFSSAPDPVSVMTKYPYLLYNMEMSPEHTFVPDDRHSLPSNNSIADAFPYVYEDMDKIKRKISDFNNKVGNMN